MFEREKKERENGTIAEAVVLFHRFLNLSQNQINDFHLTELIQYRSSLNHPSVSSIVNLLFIG
jgi:hypothetical protein